MATPSLLAGKKEDTWPTSGRFIHFIPWENIDISINLLCFVMNAALLLAMLLTIYSVIDSE